MGRPGEDPESFWLELSAGEGVARQRLNADVWTQEYFPAVFVHHGEVFFLWSGREGSTAHQPLRTPEETMSTPAHLPLRLQVIDDDRQASTPPIGRSARAEPARQGPPIEPLGFAPRSPLGPPGPATPGEPVARIRVDRSEGPAPLEVALTPDLTSILREIVGRAGWRPGNALAILIRGQGSRVAEAFDGVPAAAPLLHVEYAAPP